MSAKHIGMGAAAAVTVAGLAYAVKQGMNVYSGSNENNVQAQPAEAQTPPPETAPVATTPEG